ncbi:MAG: hypothetical protein EYC69_03680 [Bacteroidetes bacterium]|nr:MAG: hypothetical protein EYC69_03680 [Bacteroidota bacterium]
MKKSLSAIIILLFASSIFVQGQNKRPIRENVEAMKIGFLTDKLQLSPEEAQKFWPVYNQYNEELDKLRASRRQHMKDAKENMEEMTDKEAEQFVDNELVLRQDELDIQKKYHPKFKAVLSAKKVAKLYRAEEDFKRKLLEMIQNKQDGKRPGQDRRRP